MNLNTVLPSTPMCLQQYRSFILPTYNFVCTKIIYWDILWIKPNWFTIYSWYICQSLHVSRDFVPIIRRNNCVYATLGTCYSVSGMHGASTLHTRQSSTQDNKYQMWHKHSYFSWWWAQSRAKHVEIDKYTKNKLCTNLALFIRLYRDARSTERKILKYIGNLQYEMVQSVTN
jgi:hypothetical protein